MGKKRHHVGHPHRKGGHSPGMVAALVGISVVGGFGLIALGACLIHAPEMRDGALTAGLGLLGFAAVWSVA